MDTKQAQPRITGITGSSAAVSNNTKNLAAAADSADRHIDWRLGGSLGEADAALDSKSESEMEDILDDDGLLQIEEVDGTLVVSGDLDLHQAPEFRQRAEAHINVTEKPRLDLSRVPFVDSAGLAALLALSRIAKAQNKSVRLIAAGSPRRVLKITGIDRVLLLED